MMEISNYEAFAKVQEKTRQPELEVNIDKDYRMDLINI